MKKILITGTSSYIGTSFEKWISQYPNLYSVEFISLRDNDWKEISFSKYDVIFHTAAIVHISEKNKEEYIKVNRDLSFEVAKKAKNEGVTQFVFLSTMGIYGTETGKITKDTIPMPKTLYAQSKYEAEKLLMGINSENFKVAIVRPPIVYGKGCPGNYARLEKLARTLPIFPDINNERSMIYIDNLSEFSRILIDNAQSGIYFPQNENYVNTTDLVKRIAKYQRKNIRVTKNFNYIIFLGLKISRTVRKIFGSFIYDKRINGGPEMDTAEISMNYETVSFEESIKRTIL